MFDTPILFLIFDRLNTTKEVFKIISDIKPLQLFVAADGPRPDSPDHTEKCNHTREYVLKNIDWECNVKTLFRDHNLGCRYAVSSAITWFFNQVEEGIILEDDCLPSPSFFIFCQNLLEHYRNEPKIMHISGDNYQFGQKRGDGSYYFSVLNHNWGWATWRRAWQYYDLEMKNLPAFVQSNSIQKIWQDEVMQYYWLQNFLKTQQGQIDTWDYQWTFSIWHQGGLAILPNENLVMNIGFGEDATHTTDKNNLLSQLKALNLNEIKHPSTITRDSEADHFSMVYVFLGRLNDAQAIQGDIKKLLDKNQFPEALRLSQIALQAYPNSVDFLLTSAVAQSNLGSKFDAVQSLQRLLSLSPNHYQARQMLEQLKSQRSRSRAVTSTPKVTSPLTGSGNVILEKESGRTKYTPSEDIYVSIQKAMGYFNANDNASALQLFEQLLEMHPEIPEIHYGKAIALARIGQYTTAIETLKQLLSKISDHKESRDLLEKLQSIPGIAPQSVSGTEQHVNKLMEETVNLLRKDKAIDALHVIEQAASLGVDVPELHYIRVLCLNTVGRHEEALEAAKAELRINPGHQEARAEFERLSKSLGKKSYLYLNPEQRSYHTALPKSTLDSIQQSGHNFSYRGIPMIKNPFDNALYPLLIWNYKPRTIIEIGTKNGGSAIWMGDMLDNYGIEGHIYSIDIVKVTDIVHPRVTFLEGNARVTEETLSREFMQSLPHPLLIIEDADHTYETSSAVLKFFHDDLLPEEYIIIEDGIITDLSGGDNPNFLSGPHQAIKEFITLHPGEYDIDPTYNDFFGYNVTWCTNGFLKKKKYPINPAIPKGLISQFNIDNPAPQGVESQMSSNESFQLYYATRVLLPAKTSPLRFVEIGSYAGASLLLLYRALKRRVPVLQGFSVEPGGTPQFYEVLRQIGKEVQHLRLLSSQAIPQLKSFFELDGILPELIFIDGDHTYEGLRRDILDYYSLLIPGGLMVFHDYLPPLDNENREAIFFHHAGNEPGIRQACQELMENTYHCKIIDIPLLYPTDPTQTQPHLPWIPGVYSTLRVYRKP